MRPLFALSAILLILPAHESRAQEVGRTRAPLTAASNDVSNPEANAVVRLTAGGVCTGTLIAPRIVITAAHCFARPAPPRGATVDPKGGFWETPGRWYPWSNIPGGIRVAFGNDQNNPILVRTADTYNLAGYADVVMLGLTQPVPASTAVPAMLMTTILGGETPADFFGDKDLQMVGWGGTGRLGALPRFRQTASARFAAYPHVSFGYSRPNQMLVQGLGGATVIGGDSGGPLFWRDPLGKRWLVGTSQGTEPGGGRYFGTWGPGGRDGQGDMRPSLAAWIDGILVLSVNWIQIGQPAQARKITACHDRLLYVLNADNSLWKSRVGEDGSWSRVRDLPGNPRSIGCALGIVYFQKQNRELWYVTREGGLAKAGRPSGAALVSGDEDNSLSVPVLWALNDDKTLWRNNNLGTDGSWVRVGKPAAASRIASAFGTVYALNNDKTLWLNEQGGGDGKWQRIGQPRNAIEIAASGDGSRQQALFALNADYTLWKGTIEFGRSR